MASLTAEHDGAGTAGSSGDKAIPKGGSLMGRLGLTLVFVLLFSVSLSALLAYFNFEKRHRELISSRLQVMLDEVRLGIDYGTGLGLPVSSLTETGEQLKNLVKADPAIDKAVVYSAQKQRLFQAGSAEISGLIPPGWFQQVANEVPGSGVHLLIRETDDYLLVAEPIFNTFNVQSGIVVLAYSRGAYQAENAMLMKQQAWQSGLGVLVSALVGLSFLWLMMRRLRRQILRLSGSLDRQLKGDAVPEKAPNVNALQPPDELEARFQLLHDRVQEAQKASSNPSDSRQK
ncbi:hypothetical protein [Oceanospirillum sp.]|uniref:hypothetical protein n=1 Tax=Oceanospirillum sp. TaxID=2021254 RepID=UPI003A943D69